MRSPATLLRQLWADEKAEVAIEYGLLVALIALALIAVFNLFSEEVGAWFGRITDQITNAEPLPAE